MDDVLDEWSTAILKSQIEGNQFAPRRPKSKVGSLTRSSCFCCTHVVQRHHTANQIEDLNKKLDEIAREKDRCSFSVGEGSGKIDRAITTSFIDVTEVKGREADKNIIVDMLLHGSSSDRSPNPHIISIVGTGGLGKTTLAKLAFSDPRVETHFTQNQRIWVCVSDPFDENKIAKAILEHFNDDAQNLQLQTMLQRIQQRIKGKTFLLVLDDVWNENSAKWEQLIHSLTCGLPGSKILVTTRKMNVAAIMGCTNNDVFHPDLLSDDECWLIFSRTAFCGKTDRDREDLNGFRGKIVGKCKGLPLAAKTLGGLLRFRESRQEWESVLESDLWEFEKAIEDLFALLWLSYYDLPLALRPCFSYCAIFPKDHEIEKYKLVELWMAQGYLKETKSEDMEMVGEVYFRNLVMRSFFQDFEYDNDGRIISCKMHDMVHDFAQLLSKNECFITEDGLDAEEVNGMDSFYVKARHVGMISAENIFLPKSLCNLRKLRSLIIFKSNSRVEVALPNLFNHLTCLRSLGLSCSHICQIPSSINKLIHLRWLDLSYNTDLEELAATFCDLYNLETLDLSGCRDLVKLPEDIGKLIKLRHFHNFGLECLLPKGIGSLTCLRTLEFFYVGHVVEAAFLVHLKNLNRLCGRHGRFVIDGLGNRRANASEAEQVQLKKKRDIVDLVIYFRGEDEAGDWRRGHDEELIEALEPSPNLESLKIYDFKGGWEFPWLMMTLTHMKKLVLTRCENWEHLPPLGNSSTLEFLSIDKMNGVKKLGIEFLGILGFPKLKKLGFGEMSAWEEWEMDDGILLQENGKLVMPCLSSLIIRYCPKLKALPPQLLQTAQLKELIAISCPALIHRYDKRRNPQGDWHQILHIPQFVLD